MIEDLALHLGVSADSLRRLALGWCPIVEFKRGFSYCGWWVIPERDGDGVPTGLGLRNQDDDKIMYPGSKHGLIYEVNPDHEQGEKGYSSGAHNWIRSMDAGVPCAVCGKPDGCLLSAENPADPKAVVCIRTESDRRLKFGYLHIRKAEGQLTGRTALADNGGEVVCGEGMSDTAAAMDLGFNAVGRPSNLGGLDILPDLVRGRRVIVVGENDKKKDGSEPGKEGMIATYRALKQAGVDAVMVMPPKAIKDLRAWAVKHGLTRATFLAYVEEHGQRPDVEPAATGGKSAYPELLVALAADSGDQFFHDGKVSYVKLGESGNVLRVDSEAYGQELSRRFYHQYGKVPSEQALKDAQRTLTGRAQYDGPQERVFVRVAFDEPSNRIFLDLADDEGRVVVVTSEGWTVIPDSESSVRFIQHPGMEALPVPVAGGNLNELRSFVNLPNDSDWFLFLAWLLALFLPRGTRPVLGVQGTHDSGKTILSKTGRRITDPNTADLRTPPASERDLIVAADKSHVLAFDNVSKLPEWLSDALCKMSSGGGFSTRELYTNDSEMIVAVQRAVILNGIPPDLFYREDFRSRTLIVHPPSIQPGKRRSESEFWTAFAAVWPRVLGALLGAVSTALKRLPGVHLPELPRLSDFYRFVIAAGPAMPWPPGAFAKAFAKDQSSANEAALENSVVGSAIVRLVEASANKRWEGTYDDLLAALNRPGSSLITDRNDVPRSARGVSAAVARILPALRAAGIDHRDGSRRNFGNVHVFLKIGPV